MAGAFCVSPISSSLLSREELVSLLPPQLLLQRGGRLRRRTTIKIVVCRSLDACPAQEMLGKTEWEVTDWQLGKFVWIGMNSIERAERPADQRSGISLAYYYHYFYCGPLAHDLPFFSQYFGICGSVSIRCLLLVRVESVAQSVSLSRAGCA